MLEEMVFNKVIFVTTCIHAKMGAKQKLEKFISLLFSNYEQFMIVHILNQGIRRFNANIEIHNSFQTSNAYIQGTKR